jgi:hypothetical protein
MTNEHEPDMTPEGTGAFVTSLIKYWKLDDMPKLKGSENWSE